MKRKTLPGMGDIAETLASVVRRGTGSAVPKLDSPSVRRALAGVAYFAGALILGATEVTMGVYPFGAAMLCAAGGAVQTSCAFAGALLSTLGMNSGGMWQILIYVALYLARLLCSTARGAFREKGAARLRRLFSEGLHIRIMLAAGAGAAAGVVTIIGGVSLYYNIFSSFLGILLYTLFCAAFYTAGSVQSAKYKRFSGFCGILYALTLAASAPVLPANLGIMLAFFAAIWLSNSAGMVYGITAGLFCGLAAAPEAAPMFAIAAAVFSLIRDYSAAGGVITAAVAAVGWAAATGGYSALTSAAPEIVLAAALAAPLAAFGLLPGALPLFSTEDTGGDFGLSAKSEAMRERYGKISRSLDSLSKLLCSVSTRLACPSSQEAYRICTAVRARYCSGCRNEAICSGECEGEVTSFFDNMAHRISTHGRAGAAIVPEQLARRCYNMDSILDAVNTSAKKCAGLSGASQKTELYAADYAAVASLLRDSAASCDWESDERSCQALSSALSGEGFSFAGTSVYGERRRRIYLRGIDAASSTLGERDIRTVAEGVLGCRLSAPEFSIDRSYISASMHSLKAIDVKSGRYSSAGLRDDTSGDSVVSFGNDEGYYYSLVCDGMGSGRDAAICSGLSSVFLEKLLGAGAPMKSALEMLNCFIRGGDGECFATVDLMEVDLYTGKARFIKSGAAPSFVIRTGQLFRLHSKTVPVGIMRALDAEAISFELTDGDTVIMMSDGVTGSYEDCPWLYELLSEGLLQSESPSAAARLIGEAAAKNTGRDDDITVCVMKISKADSGQRA